MVAISVIYGLRYAKAPFYHERVDQHYLTRSNFTDGTNSPGDLFNTIWLNSVPTKAKTEVEIVNKEKGRVKLESMKPTSLAFSVSLNKPSKVIVNRSYFPGWKAQVNNEDVRINNYNGRMALDLKKGNSSVRLRLNNTQAQNFSYVYFLLSILAIIYFKPYANRR